MPRIDRSIQQTLWRIADTLAKILRSPSGTDPGDPRWSVSGESATAWKVDHPDLPLVRDDEGATKDVLLQFYVSRQGETWFLVAQSNVVGAEQHGSPKAVIVGKKETPPGPDWDDIEAICEKAAAFFKQQLRELTAEAQALTPSAPPGSTTPPPVPQGGMMMPGAAGPMLASRLNRIASYLTRGR